MDVDLSPPIAAPTAPSPPEHDAQPPLSPTTDTASSQELPPNGTSASSAEQKVEEKENGSPEHESANVEESNPYLQFIEKGLSEMGVESHRIIASPVVAPHLGPKAPLSSLAVYEVVSAVMIQQINAYKMLDRLSNKFSAESSALEGKIDNFRAADSKPLWRAIAAPPPLLIDGTIPNSDLEWEGVANSISPPVVETIIDAENLSSRTGFNIDWQHVTLASKVKKTPKKYFGAAGAAAASSQDLIWSLPRKDEEEPLYRTSSSGRPLKKRGRDDTPHADDIIDEKAAKKKKNLKEEAESMKDLVFRFPVQLALNIAQETFHSALSAGTIKKKGPDRRIPTLWTTEEIGDSFRA